MARVVLIAVDGSKRELFGCLSLARYLESFGFKPIICSVIFAHYYYLHYRPEAVVWPNAAYNNLGKMAKNSFVFILPAESGSGQPELIKVVHGGTNLWPVYSEYVDRFFCCGDGMKEALLETGNWREDQLIVTGSPATDHWFLSQPQARPKKLEIGITTSFRALSNSVPLKKMNYFQWLDEIESSGFDGCYYLPPEHAESWLFFEASFARAMISVVRQLVKQRKESIDIRPHPYESKSRYRYIEKISNGKAHINKRGTISQWLEDKLVLFSFNSISALDAVIRGVPAVSFKGLIDCDALRKIPSLYRYSFDNMLWQLDDISQVADYVDLAAKGRLAPCRDEEGVEKFIRQQFFFGRKYPAAQLIAKEIKIFFDNNQVRKSKFVNKVTVQSNISNETKFHLNNLKQNRFIRGLAGYILVPPLLQLITFVRYIYGLLPGKQEDYTATFQPWRIWELKEVKRIVDRIWKIKLEK